MNGLQAKEAKRSVSRERYEPSKIPLLPKKEEENHVVTKKKNKNEKNLAVYDNNQAVRPAIPYTREIKRVGQIPEKRTHHELGIYISTLCDQNKKRWNQPTHKPDKQQT